MSVSTLKDAVAGDTLSNPTSVTVAPAPVAAAAGGENAAAGKGCGEECGDPRAVAAAAAPAAAVVGEPEGVMEMDSSA